MNPKICMKTPSCLMVRKTKHRSQSLLTQSRSHHKTNPHPPRPHHILHDMATPPPRLAQAHLKDNPPPHLLARRPPRHRLPNRLLPPHNLRLAALPPSRLRRLRLPLQHAHPAAPHPADRLLRRRHGRHLLRHLGLRPQHESAEALPAGPLPRAVR